MINDYELKELNSWIDTWIIINCSSEGKLSILIFDNY